MTPFNFPLIILMVSFVSNSVPKLTLAVPLNEGEGGETSTYSTTRLNFIEKKDERAQRLEDIARQRMKVQTLQHFCTMDGLFCVPANYSK